MKILIATSGVPFRRSDVDILAGSLREALSAAGHEAELAVIPFQDHPPSRIPDQILACRLLDLTEVDRLIALNFPAYLIPHPNKVIWLVRQHRTAYELWDHATAGDLIHCADGSVIREVIRRVDRELIPEAKAVYTVSETVSRRLHHFCDIGSQRVYSPPAQAGLLHPGPSGEYFFFPGRVTGLKRQLLAIQALAKCRERTVVRFAGEAGKPAELTACTEAIRHFKLESRVEWLGCISAEQARELYAHCLGVLFLPADEDYGCIALEAMLSAKPVITCSDSGGPLEFVMDCQTGLVAQPTPESVAQAMDSLCADRRCAAAMGEAGRARYQGLDISWKNVVEKLLC